ncbi:hypothetical protein AAG906_010959 [Vitis piasezkii]|uniref:Uncharacterized protein n=1 Tax=Vitis vinifera TaxID=29760 RepID=A0A438ENU7_VITVI|nr:hypothetical protein CK203_080216 [Vitis vinifera]
MVGSIWDKARELGRAGPGWPRFPLVPASPIQASKRYSTVIGTILRPLGLGFWKMEVKKIIKDKKFWVASFLVAWAAALQGHMMWLQRQDAFKQKFGDLGQDHDPEN